MLLADFVIHSREDFKDQTVLELGAGVGLTSIVAGMFAKEVVCTGGKKGRRKLAQILSLYIYLN